MAGNSNSGGHNRKDTSELKAAGTYRKDRHADRETEAPDIPALDSLEPPKDLKGAGLELWNGCAKLMITSGQLRATDMPLFHQHCRNAQEIESLERRTRAAAQSDLKLLLRLRGQITALRSLFLRESQELGMGPVSRSRVRTVSKAPVEKPKHRRFFGKKALAVIDGGRGGRKPAS